MDMRRLSTAVLAGAALAGSVTFARAVEEIGEAYIRSLAAPGKTVLVIEYYDGQKSVVGRKGYASKSGFKALSATNFQVDPKTVLHLFGVEPCQGEMVNQREGFAGRCEDFAREQLAIALRAAKVLYCRAFVSEQSAAAQDVTCYGYYNYPGTLDGINNIEEQLLSVGALRLSKRADGASLRPDLASAERIGRGGFGMWADPRIQRQ